MQRAPKTPAEFNELLESFAGTYAGSTPSRSGWPGTSRYRCKSFVRVNAFIELCVDSGGHVIVGIAA